jgi:NAD(P)-dependent dehydrogenase (short-subunit alcohol dehydrogenase family)
MEMNMALVNVRALYDLTGKVAIVTGGAQGIGAEVARHLASAGAKVVIADINVGLAAQTAAEIVESGCAAVVVECDVRFEASVVRLMQSVQRDFGAIDILVNVAGLINRELLEDVSLEFWDRMHSVNLRGPFLTIREVAKVMRANKTAGRIINISSLGSVHPILHGLATYNASKAGLNGLTRNAAYELAADGITVNAVLPGNIPTEGQAAATGPKYTPGSITSGLPPLGRAGRTSDVAQAVLFFAGPAADWVTAQMLIVDGGSLIR